MKQKNLYGMLLALLVPMLIFNSCSNDNEDVVLETFIIGKWKTHKLTISRNDQEKSFNINKTGYNSIYYVEMDFKDNGIVEVGRYDLDEETLETEWGTENHNYTLENDKVTVYDGDKKIQFSLNGDMLLFKSSKYNETYGHSTICVYYKK